MFRPSVWAIIRCDLEREGRNMLWYTIQQKVNTVVLTKYSDIHVYYNVIIPHNEDDTPQDLGGRYKETL